MPNSWVATNIRLPKDELLTYRQIALEEGKSFSKYAREALREAAHSKVLGGKKRKSRKKVIRYEDAPLWDVKKYYKWVSKDKRGSVDHDKYIYGDPHGRGKYEW